MNRESTTIISARISRDLVREGFQLKDIRPNHQLENATVFEFYRTDEIIKYVKEKFKLDI